jgi:hypothetical protein
VTVTQEVEAPTPTPSPGFTTWQDVFTAKKDAVLRITGFDCIGDEYQGTGFVVDSTHVATVAHVVAGLSNIALSQDDGTSYSATVTSVDLGQDLALLTLSTPWNGPTIPLSQAPATVGQDVAAIGYPLGLPIDLHEGHVSAVHQPFEDSFIHQTDMVQTDANVNHGNSGGPMITMQGTAIGLVDLALVEANNINYAVSSQVANADYSRWFTTPGYAPSTDCSAPPLFSDTPYEPAPLPPSDSVPGDTPTSDPTPDATIPSAPEPLPTYDLPPYTAPAPPPLPTDSVPAEPSAEPSIDSPTPEPDPPAPEPTDTPDPASPGLDSSSGPAPASP